MTYDRVVKPGEMIAAGHQTDNETLAFLFPVVRDTVQKYGTGGTWHVTIEPPVGDAYPVPQGMISADGNAVKWTVTEADVAYKGIGKLYLRYDLNADDRNTVAEYRFVVLHAPAGDGTVPEPMENYIGEMYQIEATVRADAEVVERFLATLEGGTPNQVWTKTADGAAWKNPQGGGGGGYVDSVNGQTGDVVLSADDVGAATADDMAFVMALMPEEATEGNQLADKDFVNSSIATATAYFIGTFNSLEELEAYEGTVTPNDYAFVIGEDRAGNVQYNRYKYDRESEWQYEYTLNNSSFTAAQWAAIQSGMTASLVDQIGTNAANITAINSTISTIQQTISTMQTAISGKQNALLSAEIAAVGSGITAEKVSAYDGHVANSDIHVTAEQKTEWSGKQNALTATSTAASSIALVNNDTKVVTNTPSALAVTMDAPISGIDYVTGFIFKAGSGFQLTDTAPTGYTIKWDSGPTWTAGKVYEVIYRCLWIDNIISAKWSEVSA